MFVTAVIVETLECLDRGVVSFCGLHGVVCRRMTEEGAAM